MTLVALRIQLASLAVLLSASSACLAQAGVADGSLSHLKVKDFLTRYCVECHGADTQEADFRTDNLATSIGEGSDVERWEKALEMISIGDMPPSDADAQPSKSERQAITNWITTELKKIGRGPDDARLQLPEHGNRIDHEALFSGEHQGPAFSPSRIWRKSSHIHRDFENRLRLQQGNTPFNPKGGHGFQDYAMLLANESTISTMKTNAASYVTTLVDGQLKNPQGADGKPDRSQWVREGKSRFREFEAVARGDGLLTDQMLVDAANKAFQELLNRTPSPEETQRYALTFLKESIEIGGRHDGLKSMLMAIILSPEYVYRLEIGLGEQLPDGRRMLSPDEIAYALAYALTDSPPDDQLKKAVAEGRLSTKADVEREVRRMLAVKTRDYWGYEINHTFNRHVEACPNPRVLRFFREFFGYDRAIDVFKDKTRNPHHKPKFLFKDADLFVLSILDEDHQVLKELLTSDQYVVHYATPKQVQQQLDRIRKRNDKDALEKLAQGITPILGGYRGGQYFTTYGFEKDTWNYPIEQPFTVAHRAGMLTHPAWLVAHSGNFDTDPIRRGKWIREHLLADIIPNIPIGVDASLEEDPHKTLRQRLQKTESQSCWRCHKKMNPLGLPFESFDDFGRFREQFYFDREGNIAGTHYERLETVNAAKRSKKEPPTFTPQPIDSTGYLAGTDDPNLDGQVEDAFDLVDRLARSDRVRQSFIRHAFRYWMGRNEMLSDSPTLMAADQAYLQSDGSFKELLVSLLTSDSFLMRKDME